MKNIIFCIIAVYSFIGDVFAQYNAEPAPTIFISNEEVKAFYEKVKSKALQSNKDQFSYSIEEVIAQQRINLAMHQEWVLSNKLGLEVDYAQLSNEGRPAEDKVIDFEDITPLDWYWLDLELKDANGNPVSCYLRRPQWWLDLNGIKAEGDVVHLHLPEMNLVAYGKVRGISPSYIDTRYPVWPEDSQFVYRPITGWFKRLAPEVWNYVFSPRDTISCTPEHPFWSETRQAWVGAGELSVGEEVSTADGGRTRLVAKERRGAGPEYVYNLEVWRDHNFHVGAQGVLVHNTCLIRSWQQAVSVVDMIFKASLSELRAILPHSKIGYRGSLATGKKYKSGLPFDPSDWDVDGFIVDDRLAAKIGSSINFRDARKINELRPICDKLEENLKLMSGYRLEQGQPFTFRVWTEFEFNQKVKPYGYKLF